jgi:ribosomal protein S6
MPESETIQNPVYDLTFLSEREDLASLKKVFSKNGITITGERELVKVRLAYPIKKQAYAFMGIIVFNADPAVITDLDKDIRLDGGLLRHFVGRVKPTRASDRPARKFSLRPTGPYAVKKPVVDATLTNEALEKKIEEILK